MFAGLPSSSNSPPGGHEIDARGGPGFLAAEHPLPDADDAHPAPTVECAAA
jgi:hypothetical protein